MTTGREDWRFGGRGWGRCAHTCHSVGWGTYGGWERLYHPGCRGKGRVLSVCKRMTAVERGWLGCRDRFKGLLGGRCGRVKKEKEGDESRKLQPSKQATGQGTDKVVGQIRDRQAYPHPKQAFPATSCFQSSGSYYSQNREASNNVVNI
eukprot:761551-Hanusia_phi.AAC.9